MLHSCNPPPCVVYPHPPGEGIELVSASAVGTATWLLSAAAPTRKIERVDLFIPMNAVDKAFYLLSHSAGLVSMRVNTGRAILRVIRLEISIASGSFAIQGFWVFLLPECWLVMEQTSVSACQGLKLTRATRAPLIHIKTMESALISASFSQCLSRLE